MIEFNQEERKAILFILSEMLKDNKENQPKGKKFLEDVCKTIQATRNELLTLKDLDVNTVKDVFTNTSTSKKELVEKIIDVMYLYIDKGSGEKQNLIDLYFKNKDIFSFDTIRKYDSNKRPYWSSRDLYKLLGYSSYQKFSNLIEKTKKSFRPCEPEIVNHFTLVTEKVKLGSQAIRGIDTYHLSKEACRMIVKRADEKKAGVMAARLFFMDCKDSNDTNNTDTQKINKQYWEKLNSEASGFYKEDMKKLENVLDFKRDDYFNNHYAPNHIMYKMETVKSEDKHRAYEFLIEYNIFEPTVGIYYGCKGLIKNGTLDEEINIFNKEWGKCKDEVIKILNNTFPDKDFTHRIKPTNNANDNTYWLFWITLYEDEDIIEVGARATRIIRSVFSKKIFGHKYLPAQTKEYPETIKEIKGRLEELQKMNTTNTAFTDKAYLKLLSKIIDDEGVQLFKKIINRMIENRYLNEVDIYEKAYSIQMNIVDFSFLLVQIFKKMSRPPKTNKVPWEDISNVFLDKDNNRFKKDSLKATRSGTWKNPEKHDEAACKTLNFILR